MYTCSLVLMDNVQSIFTLSHVFLLGNGKSLNYPPFGVYLDKYHQDLYRNLCIITQTQFVQICYSMILYTTLLSVSNKRRYCSKMRIFPN